MMKSEKHTAGSKMASVTLPKMDGGTLTLGQPQNGHDWQLVIVYRGKHCPLCTNYLKELNTLLPDFNDLGVDVVAVSADPKEKVEEQINPIAPNYAVGYDLSMDQMRDLGLYISEPRSPQETDRPFAEPGMFLVNADGNLQMTDISNAPFLRPELSKIVNGIRFVRNPDNNYPIRGTA